MPKKGKHSKRILHDKKVIDAGASFGRGCRFVFNSLGCIRTLCTAQNALIPPNLEQSEPLPKCRHGVASKENQRHQRLFNPLLLALPYPALNPLLTITCP